MPTAFVAVTLKPYVSPVVSPVTRMPLEDPAPVTVPVNAPAIDVALYDVITEPLSAGASNQTVIVVGPVEVNLGFNGDEGTLADAVAVADADLLAVAEGVVEALALALALAVDADADVDALADADLLSDAEAEGVVEALVLALALGVGLSDGEAVAPAAATGASPRMTGAPDSASPELPHPARSITAHAMTAPAAFPFRLLEPNPLNRLLAALIGRRASPGQWPIIVHV